MPTKGKGAGKDSKSKRKTKPASNVSAKEILCLRDVFNEHDKNNDRKISREELIAALKSLKKPHSEKDVDEKLKQLDTDKTGFITLNEFMLIAHNDDDVIGATSDELKQAFSLFDKNKDGFIDSKELKVVVKTTGWKMSQAEVDEMMTALDADKDGKICYKEFINLWTNV